MEHPTQNYPSLVLIVMSSNSDKIHKLLSTSMRLPSVPLQRLQHLLYKKSDYDSTAHLEDLQNSFFEALQFARSG
jgi:hypothetical protein